jgi:hypothetical protein
LRRIVWAVLALGLAAGLLYRLAPLVLGPDALARFFVTEDGYLMLTVARNLAIGNGLSVAAGEIATNGVQPLATLLYALPYLATGGDKVASLAGVIAIQAAWSVGAALAVRAWARGVLGPLDPDPSGPDPLWPWLAAALWFLGPLALLHSMNGLETGLYVLAVAATATYFGRVTARAAPRATIGAAAAPADGAGPRSGPGTGGTEGVRYTGREQVILGLLCGFVFLARIDGAILVTALFAARFLHVTLSGRLSVREAVAEAVPPGLISLAVAAPWLLHNQILFGSIMPISGPAQSISAEFAQNLDRLPVKLFETMLPMLPVPERMEWNNPPLQVAAAAVVLGVMARFLWRLSATGHPFRVAVWGYAGFGLGLCAYYGLHHGAGHFLSRYLAPLAPLLIAAALYVAIDLVRTVGARALLRGAVTASVVLALALSLRLALPGVKRQGHFHVVEWVERNVPDDTWVGAVQTGTLGYWHDRTVNLDGKVNPEALAARIERGHVLDYVAASRIDVIADWYGMSRWVERARTELASPAFAEAFEVVVADRRADLAVLRRRGTGIGDGEIGGGGTGSEIGGAGAAPAPRTEAAPVPVSSTEAG